MKFSGTAPPPRLPQGLPVGQGSHADTCIPEATRRGDEGARGDVIPQAAGPGRGFSLLPTGPRLQAGVLPPGSGPAES